MAFALSRGLGRLVLSSASGKNSISKTVSSGIGISGKPSLCSEFHLAAVNRNIINIQDEDDFRDRVVNSSLPVIVDFHATWCGPCKLLGPKLEAMVEKNEGKVVMAKVDIDDHSELAMAFKVQAVPTVMAVKGGKVVDGFMGLKDDDQLKTFVDKVIAA